MNLGRKLAETRKVLAERGPGASLQFAAQACAWRGYLTFQDTRLASPVFRALRSAPTFAFAGRSWRYFHHPYNWTWRNERAVEIPLARGFLQEQRRSRLLEVGNVTAHYGFSGHDVVDKYELAPGVRNEDIVDFAPDGRYDAILSISTLEHVGVDEEPPEPGKVLRAIAHLRSLLADGGAMLVTMPLGYNDALDLALADGARLFPDQRYLKRVSLTNEWREVELEEARSATYWSHYPFANAILVGSDGWVPTP